MTDSDKYDENLDAQTNMMRIWMHKSAQTVKGKNIFTLSIWRMRRRKTAKSPNRFHESLCLVCRGQVDSLDRGIYVIMIRSFLAPPRIW